MNCKDCPYIMDELQEKMTDYQQIIEYDNELYQYIAYQYIIDKWYLHCFCKKIDNCLIMCDEYCDNIYPSISQSRAHSKKLKKHSKKPNAYWIAYNKYANNARFHSKKKRGYKRRQYLRNKKQLQQLWRIVRYPYPVIYVDTIKINGEYCNRKVPYYRREWESHGGLGRRFCKRMSNRCVRRYKGGISKGGNYRKIYDYQWTLD